MEHHEKDDDYSTIEVYENNSNRIYNNDIEIKFNGIKDSMVKRQRVIKANNDTDDSDTDLSALVSYADDGNSDINEFFFNNKHVEIDNFKEKNKVKPIEKDEIKKVTEKPVKMEMNRMSNGLRNDDLIDVQVELLDINKIKGKNIDNGTRLEIDIIDENSLRGVEYENLLNSFKSSLDNLKHNYDGMKLKMSKFDKQLNERLNQINTEITKQINNLYDEIKRLESLLKLGLAAYVDKLNENKFEIGKQMVHINEYLTEMSSRKADLLNNETLLTNQKKLIEYQQYLNNIPNYLNRNFYNFLFIPSNLRDLSFKHIIGHFNRTSVIDQLKFNLSIEYKNFIKYVDGDNGRARRGCKLWQIHDCNFNQHLILIEWNSNNLHIINHKSLDYVKNVKLFKKLTIKGLCMLNHKKRICLFDNTNRYLYLLNENYRLIKQIEFSDNNMMSQTVNNSTSVNNKRSFESIDFNESNNLIYIIDLFKRTILIFDENLNYINEIVIQIPLITRFKEFYSFIIKIFHNKIFINDLINNCYHIFDENVRYITTINNSCSGEGKATRDNGSKCGEYSHVILLDTINNCNYLLIINLFDKSISIYDIINYEFIKKINLNHLFQNQTINNAIIVDNSILFLTDNDIQVFDITSSMPSLSSSMFFNELSIESTSPTSLSTLSTTSSLV